MNIILYRILFTHLNLILCYNYIIIVVVNLYHISLKKNLKINNYMEGVTFLNENSVNIRSWQNLKHKFLATMSYLHWETDLKVCNGYYIKFHFV